MRQLGFLFLKTIFAMISMKFCFQSQMLFVGLDVRCYNSEMLSKTVLQKSTQEQSLHS